jgi:hypothetical protein
MAANKTLLRFVREALGRDATQDEIRAALSSAGWGTEDVERALGAFADVAFPIPVPKPRPDLSPRDAFVYLVIFSTLGIAAFHFGALVFELINRVFPDTVFDSNAERSADAVRRAIASLIVTFPIYLILSATVAREIRFDPTKAASKIRKWLTYITLFLAASVLIGDATTVLYSLLGGELSVRFGLKALTVGVIAGLIFGYYLWDLREEKQQR